MESPNAAKPHKTSKSHKTTRVPENTLRSGLKNAWARMQGVGEASLYRMGLNKRGKRLPVKVDPSRVSARDIRHIMTAAEYLLYTGMSPAYAVMVPPHRHELDQWACEVMSIPQPDGWMVQARESAAKVSGPQHKSAYVILLQ